MRKADTDFRARWLRRRPLRRGVNKIIDNCLKILGGKHRFVGKQAGGLEQGAFAVHFDRLRRKSQANFHSGQSLLFPCLLIQQVWIWENVTSRATAAREFFPAQKGGSVIR